MLESGVGYDAVWYCGGGIVYRVHKFVLAAFSDHMKVKLMLKIFRIIDLLFNVYILNLLVIIKKDN